ncbi:MAG: Trimeric GatFAB AmidoTransferase(AdT) complex subunit [Pycnora praestabilis]|nr:MAG: Trimeric GatFAB AmidoTransferase(AdT) complex subunit [Pycnora praestabilis]
MSLLREAKLCLSRQSSMKALNAFITGVRDEASLFVRVQEAEERFARGEQTSPLDGALIGIKDNICTSDFPTTCASRILKDFRSPFDATVIEKLRTAGALLVGKTNLDEFGMGSHSTHSYFGHVRNQQLSEDADLSVGGSSGGSAVAVATGQCLAALGTDTGGSIRLPAAYTGTVGFKPSYGMVSRWGVVAYANSLDTVGIMARDSSSAGKVFDIIKGHDPRDPTSLANNTRSRIRDAQERGNRKRELRIGFPLEYNITELNPSIRQTWVRTLQQLQAQGHSIRPVSLLTTRSALSAYYVLAPAEASSNLAKYDGVRYGWRVDQHDGAGGVLFAKTRGTGFGDEVKRRILLGAYSLSADAIDNHFLQAQRVRRLVQQDFDRIFALPNPLFDAQEQQRYDPEQIDILVCPTAPTFPPTLDSLENQEPVETYMNDVFTVPASLAGLPAMSVPVHAVTPGTERSRLPKSIGMQVIAQYGDDDLIIEMGRVLEEVSANTQAEW